KTFVCTLLIGLEPSDVSGPLKDFQATKPTKEDLLKLVRTLNTALEKDALKDAHLEAAFDLCWPKLKERLDTIPQDGAAGRPHRSDRELLEELVDTVRSTTARMEDRMVMLQMDLGDNISSIKSAIISAAVPNNRPKYTVFLDDLGRTPEEIK